MNANQKSAFGVRVGTEGNRSQMSGAGGVLETVGSRLPAEDLL